MKAQATTTLIQEARVRRLKSILDKLEPPEISASEPSR